MKKKLRKIKRAKVIIRHEYQQAIQVQQYKSVLQDIVSYYIPLNKERRV